MGTNKETNILTFNLFRLGETALSTWGKLVAPDSKVLCDVLERGGSNKEHPRIPAGTYPIEFRTSPSKFDHTLRELLGDAYLGVPVVMQVPLRSNIEIHPANRLEELEGCLAPNMTIGRDDNDNFMGFASLKAYRPFYLSLKSAKASGPVELTVHDIQGSITP